MASLPGQVNELVGHGQAKEWAAIQQALSPGRFSPLIPLSLQELGGVPERGSHMR